MSVQGPGGKQLQSAHLVIQDVVAGAGTERTELIAPDDRRIHGYHLTLPFFDGSTVVVEARLNVGQDRNHGESNDVGGFFSVQNYMGIDITGNMVGDQQQSEWFGPIGFTWNEDSALILAGENSASSTRVARVDADIWYTEE